MSQSSASLPAEPARNLRRAFHGSADRSHRGTPELPARQDDPWSVTLSDARRRADQRATALTSVGPSRRAHTGAEPVYTALGRVAVGNLSVAVRADHCRPGGVSWSTGLRGMRYPVQSLLELLSSGMTIEDVLADYPDLERENLLAALEFGALTVGGHRVVPRGTA